MNRWLLTVTSPSSPPRSIETGEAQFFVGTDTAADVYTVTGEGVAPRHAWMWIGESAVQIEDLAGGTRVNGHLISARVQTGYPASIQVGGITLHLEALSPAGPEQSPEPLAATIPVPRGMPRESRSHAVRDDADTLRPQGPDQHFAAAAMPPASDAAPRTYPDAPLEGGYTLVKEIARGGMGQIHLGDDPLLGRQVAVKVSSLSHGGADPRFEKETRVLARLAHPNIVPIHAKGTDTQGRPFYSMKLIKGRTLQAVLNAMRDGDAAAIHEYPRSTLLTVFRKVCDALAFAHSKQILHRDLKPDNIMVGEYGEVLVMDWGLAKELGEHESLARSQGLHDSGDYSMTMEGEVMGTPQYMSPEQAQGMVAELDVRSDIYSLGGILYAILTLRPPVEGRTLQEVLTRVKSGEISAMVSPRSQIAGTSARLSEGMSREIPGALQAVTLKAMALDRERRYASVEEFASDIEAYLSGFATSAENAGFWRQAGLWVKRNRMLTGAAAVLGVVVAGFTARVIQKGREANHALQSLRETAPTFAIRARDALHDGQFKDALKAATFASNLEPETAQYHALRGDALQLLSRWPEALDAYHTALRLENDDVTRRNLALTETLIALLKTEGEDNARREFFKALNTQGRQYEAMALARDLGGFWKNHKEDLAAAHELIKQLEEKLLPIPGTDIVMSKTEFTVGEWKLYARAAGLPEWEQPGSWKNGIPVFIQTDDHPVVFVSWKQAKECCDWLSSKTKKQWRLPTDAEWEAAVGESKYPWGEYYPPRWDDGNYAAADNGATDPNKVGVDGIFGTAPVASFKPNTLGFYDLGGNVFEWMWERHNDRNQNGGEGRVVRGGGWNHAGEFCLTASKWPGTENYSDATRGFRVIRHSTP